MTRGLERLERRTNRLFWDDGLLDLFGGLGVLFIGMSWLGDVVPLGAAAPALAVPLWVAARKRFTEPRLGLVELSEPRQRKNRAFTVGTLVAGVFTLALAAGVFFFAADQVPGTFVPALPGVLLALPVAATALVLQLPRLLVYAAALASTGAACAALDCDPGWAFVVGGAVAFSYGARLVYGFARAYPFEPPS